MKNVVTGANGLLGAHVVLELLKRGEQVIAMDRSTEGLPEVQAFFKRWDGQAGALYQKIEWQQADVLDLPALEQLTKGVDHLYHCAGYVSFEHREREKLMRINEQGTANVVAACMLNGVKLCHVSSVAVLHNLDHKLPLDEKVFWKKSGRESVYAISKYNAEREVWRGIEEGLQAVIVNPGVIIPAAFWQRSSAKMVHTVYQGNPFYTPGVAAYVAAADVARVMLALLEGKHFSERFIVAEACYTFKEVFTWMAQDLGKTPPRFAIPKWLLMSAARVETLLAWLRGKPAKVSPDLVHSAFNTQGYSTQKLQKTLNYAFMPTREVVRQAAKYYLEDRKNGRD